MSEVKEYRRQLVDWSSAIWAGLVAGLLLWMIYTVVVPGVFGGNAWVMIRLLASIVMGSAILAPPAEFHGMALLCALLTHFVMSILYALLLAVITHRWGLVTGILVGALFGAGIYVINVYTMTLWFPWFILMKHSFFLMAHIVFGACAGGVYELLEVEEFEYIKRN